MYVLHFKKQLVRCLHHSMRQHGETQERREPFPLQTSFPRRVIQPTHPDEQMLFVFKRAQVDTAAVMSCAYHHVVNIWGLSGLPAIRTATTRTMKSCGVSPRSTTWSVRLRTFRSRHINSAALRRICMLAMTIMLRRTVCTCLIHHNAIPMQPVSSA